MRAAIADIVGRAGVDRNEKLRDLLDRHSVERRLSPSSAPLLAALRVLSNVRAKDRSSKTSVAARELVLRRKSCRPRSPVQGTVADELGSRWPPNDRSDGATTVARDGVRGMCCFLEDGLMPVRALARGLDFLEQASQPRGA